MFFLQDLRHVTHLVGWLPVALQDIQETAPDASFGFLKMIIAVMWACMVLC